MLKRANKTTTDSSINGILDDFFSEKHHVLICGMIK
nr:MAG TPA: hypothetical protein [Caudoviricetes sp.]